MKYHTAKVVGHPRSGSHYLAHILNINFFHRENHLALYAGHSKAHKIHLRSPGVAVFYTYRNNYDTICSMYKIRDRLGLKANSLEEFIQSKLSDMNDDNITSNAILNINGNKKVVTDVDHYMGEHDLTPEEYLLKHKAFWLQISADNYMPIFYDLLIADFKGTMLNIAKFLGSDKTVFINETSRVGWYDSKDEVKVFT